MTHTQTNTPKNWLDLLNDMANQADDIAMHYFNGDLNITQKKDKTLVTQGDLEIERAVRKSVGDLYPDLAIYGEEFGACDEAEPYKLIIDPIDGTSNFIRGIPFFGSLMAIEVNGQIVAGTISNPVTKDRWWAGKGTGAFYNGNPIKTSNITDIKEAQAFYGSLYGSEARGDTEKLLKLLAQTKRQRGFGDFYAHCLVAQGCGEFAIDFGLKPWDIAPLGILVEEAGGKVCNLDGSTFTPYEGSIVSANSSTIEEVVLAAFRL